MLIQLFNQAAGKELSEDDKDVLQALFYGAEKKQAEAEKCLEKIKDEKKKEETFVSIERLALESPKILFLKAQKAFEKNNLKGWTEADKLMEKFLEKYKKSAFYKNHQKEIDLLAFKAWDYSEMVLVEGKGMKFYMDKYEVTNKKYAEFCRLSGHKVPEKDWDPEGKPNYPVVWVTYDDAVAYCDFLGKKLPTEEEWRLAAFGTDGRKYPWGNEFTGKECNVAESNVGCLCEVGKFEKGKSFFGCYEMIGNAWEWINGGNVIGLCYKNIISNNPEKECMQKSINPLAEKEYYTIRSCKK